MSSRLFLYTGVNFHDKYAAGSIFVFLGAKFNWSLRVTAPPLKMKKLWSKWAYQLGGGGGGGGG